jgi:cobalt-zinc-cadmium efflux system membrane fusion protein
LVDGTTNAFKIISTASVWIDGQIYEKDITRINQKTKVDFISSTYPGEKFSGSIINIGQTIDERSRTITIRAEFKNPDRKLKPQMFGEMLIPSNENSMAILIPAESIIKIENQDHVFVRLEDFSFQKRKVLTGTLMDELIEIKEGLNEKDQVVTKGAFYLKSESLKDQIEEHEH